MRSNKFEVLVPERTKRRIRRDQIRSQDTTSSLSLSMHEQCPHVSIVRVLVVPNASLSTSSHEYLSCPPSLPSRLVPLVKVLHAPLSLPKSTSSLDQSPNLSPLSLVSKDITPPSIQASSMERPLTQVDITF